MHSPRLATVVPPLLLLLLLVLILNDTPWAAIQAEFFLQWWRAFGRSILFCIAFILRF